MGQEQGFKSLRVAAFESRMADEMARLITRYGGRPFVAPSMREVPLEDNRDLLAFGAQLLAGRFDMVILLTGVGTGTMAEVLQTRWPLDQIKAALGRVVLVARGPKPVAALKRLDLTPTITVPEPNTWRDLLQTLDTVKPPAGLRIAVQEYGTSNVDLLKALKERGAIVSRVPVYRWTLPEDTAPLRRVLDFILAGQMDVVLITNAVQVDHVMHLLEESRQADLFRQAVSRMIVASVGPTASDRLKTHGLPVDLEPSHPKMGILVRETSEQAHKLLQRKRSA